MKKGLLALVLLALVAAIPACKQRDGNDKDRGCNPCSWFRCKKKCDDGEVKVEKPKKKKRRKNALILVDGSDAKRNVIKMK